MKIKTELLIGGFISLILGLIGANFLVSYYSASNKTKNEGITVSPSPKNISKITIDEVMRHNNKNDCWIIINDQALDVTPFLPLHPGGEDKILAFCGKDATEAFNKVGHSNKAIKMITDYVIGVLGQQVNNQNSSQ